MLLSQGWTPGTYLGATNAPHKHLHSDASASFIRVAIKDDNLGLGAKRGPGPGECTGLDAFQGILGRLNGKSDAVLEKEQDSRDNLKRALYTERRWGTLHFVSGGLLVGSRTQKLSEDANPHILAETGADDSLYQSRQKNSPKRIASMVDVTAQSEPISIDSGYTYETEASTLDGDDDIAAQGREKDGKYANSTLDKSTVVLKKSQRKKEKLQRRLDRKKRKEERRIRRLDKRPDSVSPSTISPTSVLQGSPKIDVDLPVSACVPAQPAAISMTGRHAVRQRYIRQKKLALMDPRALNEVRRY